MPTATDKAPTAKDRRAAASDFITSVSEALARLLDDVEQARQTTAGEAWRKLYAAQSQRAAREREGQVSRLRAFADEIEKNEPAPDQHKDLGALRGEIHETAIRESSFREMVVEPLRAPVRRYEARKREALDEAAVMQQREPLLHEGLVAALRQTIDSVPKAAWDDEIGAVTLTGGVAGGGS